MARPVNIEEPGGLYHIYFKTNHDRFALVKPFDINFLIALMHVYKQKHGIKIFGYSIMSNHIHLLLKNHLKHEDGIKKFLRDVKREYAKWHNIRYGYKGNFWKASYRQKPIAGDIQLINTLVYILNNPVEAHLSERAQDYADSSFHLLMTKKEIKENKKQGKFISKKELRALFHKSKKQVYSKGLSDKVSADKTRGPYPYYFPKKTANHIGKREKWFSLAITDELPQAMNPGCQLLKTQSRVRIHANRERKYQMVDPFKIMGQNIIFESKTKAACLRFQELHAQRLSINALKETSIIETDWGSWAIISPPGRGKAAS